MPHPIHLVLTLACLTACSVSSTNAPEPRAPRVETVPTATPAPALPIAPEEDEASHDHYEPSLAADACTPEGYWSFFETFVYSPRVRAQHTLASAPPAARDFRIALVDNQWMLKDTPSGTYRPIEIIQQREGNAFTVTYRALDSADATMEPVTYRFVLTDGCWQLAEQSEP